MRGIMEKLDNTIDVKKYLENGNLTEPFMDIKFLKQELEKVSTHRKEQNLDGDIEWCLMDFIHQNLKFCKDKDFVDRNQFSRTVQEIFESKLATGCTDYAYVYASLARQLGIPTTILQTSQKEWTNKLINNIGNSKMHYGHTFCECFLNGKWVLVDPSNRKIDWQYEKYASFKIQLEWKIGDSRTFLPYFRGLDLGTKMSLNDFLVKESGLVKKEFFKIYDTNMVKQRYEQIKSPEELKNFMNEIFSYGWLDVENNEHLETMKELQNYKAMSIGEIFDYKIESCLEGAKFAQYWFSKHNMATKIYFSRMTLKNIETGVKSYPDMHFLVLFECDKGKWGRFEQVNPTEQGVYYFDNFDDAFQHVLAKHKKQEDFYRERFKDEKNSTFSLGLFEFKELEDNLTFDKLQNMADEKENLYNNNITDEKKNEQRMLY